MLNLFQHLTASLYLPPPFLGEILKQVQDDFWRFLLFLHSFWGAPIQYLCQISSLITQKSVVSVSSACHFLVQSGRIIFLLPQTVQSGSPNEPNLLHPCQSKSRGNRLQYGIPCNLCIGQPACVDGSWPVWVSHLPDNEGFQVALPTSCSVWRNV